MPRKPKAVKSTDENRIDGFARQVELALEHFDDPAWIGENSLLAAPFVLGQPASGSTVGETGKDRGNALRLVLQHAAEKLDMESSSVIADIYFQRNGNLNNAALAMRHNMSERTFYRWRQQAVVDLANEVYLLLLPPLRLENPPLRPFVGRNALNRACYTGLVSGQSVYISGASGVGKTALAAQLYRTWPHPRLWYTVRAGLADRVSNFIFALGYFLRSLGATTTWRQLLADKGALQLEKVLTVLRYDLEQFASEPILLCVDEVDVLTPERNEHAQFLHVLDELRSQTRLVLLGQRIVLEADLHYRLAGFDEDEFSAWLVSVGAQAMPPGDRSRLLAVTSGQPAFLSLVWTLIAASENAADVLAGLPGDLSLEALWARVWRRLDEASRQVLMEISVFMTAAPMDYWDNQTKVMSQLVERNLLIPDQQGGVECDPHIRPFVYERIPVELRAALHLRAAVALEERGEFVRAMNHYVLGRQPAQAVWLWFSHRVQQVERGQGPAALVLLEQVVSTDLPDDTDRAALALARAELYRLVGRPDAIVQALDNLPSGRTGVAAAYAQQLLGDALDRQGDIERSLAAYRRALETLAGSAPFREVIVHQRIVYLHLTRIPDPRTAKREAMYALFHAETFAANVDEFAGDLEAARAQYLRAVAVAEATEHNEGILAIGYSHLGMVLLKIGELEAAVENLRRSMELSEQRGDMLGPLYDRFNLSYAYVLQGNFDEALNIAKDGLPIAERMRHTYCIAGLAAGAADACNRKGDLESAENYALQSLMQEEEYFRPWALTVLGLVQGNRGAFNDAVNTLNAAIDSAQANEDEYGEAYAQLALGEVNWLGRQPGPAGTAFARALQTYRKIGARLEAERVKQRMDELGISLPM